MPFLGTYCCIRRNYLFILAILSTVIRAVIAAHPDLLISDGSTFAIFKKYQQTIFFAFKSLKKFQCFLDPPSPCHTYSGCLLLSSGSNQKLLYFTNSCCQLYWFIGIFKVDRLSLFPMSPLMYHQAQHKRRWAAPNTAIFIFYIKYLCTPLTSKSTEIQFASKS